MANQTKVTLRWAAEAKSFFIGIAGLTGAGTLGIYIGDGSNAIKYCGLILQLAGLILVAIGIRDTRKLFNRPPLTERLTAWVKRFPLKLKPITGQISGTSSFSVTGTGRITAARDPAKPISDRVALIENELDQVWTQLSNNQQAVLSKINETKDSAQKELNEHRTALEETKKQLEKFSVGGLDLEIVGLVWLFIGITAATIPDELLRVFK